MPHDLAVRPEEFYISVCSGGGGLDVGVRLARPGARCVCYVERGAPAASALVAAMEAGTLDEAPVWGDAVTFDGRRFRGRVAGVVGGTPCPEFSLANAKRKPTPEEQLATVRGSLFWRLFEIADECGARWVFWENVGGSARALQHALPLLEARGWRGAYVCLRASDVDAPHERARWFLLAHREGLGRGEGRTEPAWLGGGPDAAERGGADGAQAVADGDGDGCEGERERGLREDGHPQPGHDTDGCGGTLPDVAGGCPLGHGHGQGLEGRPPLRGHGEAQRATAHRAGLGSLPLWPPGPADVEGWRRVLSVAPFLAPALPQPGIRRVVDGMALASGGLDRIELLRLLGNGVVPDQAAAAFLLLSNHLQL